MLPIIFALLTASKLNIKSMDQVAAILSYFSILNNIQGSLMRIEKSVAMTISSIKSLRDAKNISRNRFSVHIKITGYILFL